MIFIVISIDTRPEKRDEFLAGITRYCDQVRAEPGNLRFTCSEDVEESNRFVVVPSPSFPSRLFPQQRAVPSDNRAQV